MYGYVIIGNREINLNNNNNTNNNNNFQNVPNINNTNPDNNQIEEINLLENPHAHQIARSRTLARVGYTELRNILQIRINLSNENQANDININNRIPLSDDPIQERSSNNENNEVMSREISSNSNLGGNDDTVINELNQNLSVSQINPINDSLNMVSIANNTQEVRESEELLGMIEQANLRINPANSL